MELSLPSQQTCPHCDSNVEADPKRGETVCTECGTIVTEGTVDHGPEWTAYTASEREDCSRVGRPTTASLHDRGLSTVISQEDRDAHGRRLSSRKRQQMRRLRTWDERYRTREKSGISGKPSERLIGCRVRLDCPNPFVKLRALSIDARLPRTSSSGDRSKGLPRARCMRLPVGRVFHVHSMKSRRSRASNDSGLHERIVSFHL